MVIEFSDRQDDEAHASFERWKSEHPSGFVLNIQGPGRAMLHVADCLHLTFASDDDVSLTAKAKLASLGSQDLLAEADRRGLGVIRCSRCNPLGL